jgi:hypothetical protein
MIDLLPGSGKISRLIRWRRGVNVGSELRQLIMNTHELFERWWGRARTSQMAHYKSAVRYEGQHWHIGIWLVALNAVVSSAVFSTLSETADQAWVKIVIGFVSMSAAVLAGVQTFLSAGEKAESHRSAAASFSRLQREIERYAATGDRTESAVKLFLDDFDKRYGQLIQEAPTAYEQFHRICKEQHDADLKSGKLSFTWNQQDTKSG